MKALNHKNIVNLREVLSSRTKLYIVMDLVRGGELFEMIENRGELDEVLARKYFQQLIDGIDYCHRRGVCHRDLKVRSGFGVCFCTRGTARGAREGNCARSLCCAISLVGLCRDGCIQLLFRVRATV